MRDKKQKKEREQIPIGNDITMSNGLPYMKLESQEENRNREEKIK